MRPLWLLLVAAGLGIGGRQATALTLYQTQFSPPQFAPNYYWAGVDGWRSNFPDNGSVGVLAEGNAVYLGYNDPQSEFGVFVWRPLDFQPVKRKKPVVTIETVVAIFDSSVQRFDPFAFGIYNRAGEFLCAFYLDNETLRPFFSDGSTTQMLAVPFRNNTFFRIRLRLDFSTNRACAWFGPQGSEIVVFEDRVMHSGGRTLDLGEFDFLWLTNSGGVRGDNFLAIDSLTISADALPALKVPKRVRTRSSAVLLKGRLDEEAHLGVEFRPAGSKKWKKARSRRGKWSCKVRGLRNGTNVVELRTVNTRGRQVELERVVVERR